MIFWSLWRHEYSRCAYGVGDGAIYSGRKDRGVTRGVFITMGVLGGYLVEVEG